MVRLLDADVDGRLWLTVDELKKNLSGYDPKIIDLLIKGLSESVAMLPDKTVLINLKSFRDNLIAIQALTNKESGAPVKTKVKGKWQFQGDGLFGKQVAARLGCHYDDIILLITKHGLPATRYGRAWFILLENLATFQAQNQGIIDSLKEKQQNTSSSNSKPPVPSQSSTEPLIIPDTKDPPKDHSPDTKVNNGADPADIQTQGSIESDAKKEEPKEEGSIKEPQEQKMLLLAAPRPIDVFVDSKPATVIPPKKPENSQVATYKYTVPIIEREYGYLVDDVALALGTTAGRVLQLKDKVKHREIPDSVAKHRQIADDGVRVKTYFDPEALRAFLLETKKIRVTTAEHKGSVGLPKT